MWSKTIVPVSHESTATAAGSSAPLPRQGSAFRGSVRALAGKLRAGAATYNYITPSLGCSLAGSMRNRIADEVHDELHVRSLVLDNGSTRLALAIVDSCVVPRKIIDRAKELIREQTQIPASHALVSATHTHSAPPAAHLFQSEADPAYQGLVERSDRRCRASGGQSTTADPNRMGGSGREDRLVFNRRFFMKPGTIPPDPFGRTTDTVRMNPPRASSDLVRAAGPTDPEVGILAVESLDGAAHLRPGELCAALRRSGGVYSYHGRLLRPVGEGNGTNRRREAVPTLPAFCSHSGQRLLGKHQRCRFFEALGPAPALCADEALRRHSGG